MGRERETGEGSPNHIIVGRIRRAHGVRGDVVVELFTDAPESLLAPGSRLIAGNARGDVTSPLQELNVSESSPFQDGLIVHFDEIGDKDVAGQWRQRFLLVPRDAVPPPAEGEMHIHDLVGLRVDHRDGRTLGTVTGFYELRQGLMLDVKGADGEFLLPYRDEFVSLVDREAGRLVVDLPDGFFE